MPERATRSIEHRKRHRAIMRLLRQQRGPFACGATGFPRAFGQSIYMETGDPTMLIEGIKATLLGNRKPRFIQRRKI